MAIVSPSLLRSKYALAGALALVAAGLGTLGYQSWNANPGGLFGDTAPAGATRSIVGADNARVGGLTGIDVVDNALDVLAGRSPGERTVGVSGKGKGKGPARAYRYTRSPAARALEEAFSSPGGASRIIEAPAAPGAAANPSIILPPELFSPAAIPGIVDSVLPATGGNFTGPGGGLFSPPGGFSVGLIGGGGGGGGTPAPTPTSPPVIITPTVPAIPEPSTWMMLLLGLASIGAMMRAGKGVADTGARRLLNS